MKTRRIVWLVLCLVSMLAPAAHAQWTVFDPTNYANALQEYLKLEQAYTTAVETRDQIITAYNLAYKMSRMPQDLAARYQSGFSQWTNVSAANTYGNTSAWIEALNLGGLAQASQAYASAVVPLEPYPAGSYASLDPNTQATVANQYATSELAQGTTTSTLATLGAIRSNSEAFAQKLANLESDTYSTDPNQQTQNALLARINAATLLELHSQQDANQVLAAAAGQQLVAGKQQIDTQNRAINQAIAFHQNFSTLMQNITSGVSDSIHAISLSPTGR